MAVLERDLVRTLSDSFRRYKHNSSRIADIGSFAGGVYQGYMKAAGVPIDSTTTSAAVLGGAAILNGLSRFYALKKSPWESNQLLTPHDYQKAVSTGDPANSPNPSLYLDNVENRKQITEPLKQSGRSLVVNSLEMAVGYAVGQLAYRLLN